MRRSLGGRIALALCLAAIAAAADAQTSVEGSSRGYVRDEQGAVLPGVTVTARGATAAQTQTAVTDAGGYYRLLNLTPATYTVTAELQGFSRFARDQVIVRAGLTISVDIQLKLGTLEETVEVKAETPMLEVASTAQAVNISGEFQRALPTS